MKVPAWVLVALLGFSHAAVGWRAWTWASDRAEVQQAAARASLEADLAAVAAMAREAARKLQAAQDARAPQVQELEDEARADPSAAGRVPSADSLRRLKARWGTD